MERRVLLAISLSFLVLFLFQRFVMPPPPQTPVSSAVATQATPATQAAPVAAPTQPVSTPAPAAIPSTVGEGNVREVVVETTKVKAVFSNKGGVVAHWILKEFSTDQGKPLDLVPQGAGPAARKPFALTVDDPALTGRLNDSVYRVTVNGQAAPESVDATTAKQELVFETAGADGLAVRKAFTFEPDGYVISVATQVQLGPQQLNPVVHSGPGLGDEIARAKPASFFSPSYSTPAAPIFHNGSVTRVSPDQSGVQEGTLRYAGIQDHYFASLLLNEQNTQGVRFEYSPAPIPQADDPAIIGRYVQYGVRFIMPQAQARFYVGPKEFERLRAIDPEVTRIVDYGIFSFLAVPLLDALKRVHEVIGNWGWSIIVLTILINLVLFPLRHKSVVSMRKMQEIQPQMKAIQDRYAKYKVTDPERQKMNTEVMELYKSKGVNPASGCIPMLLTFPFLFAFYNMLSQSIELRGADFAFWIHNLSAPDPYYVFPILNGAAQFWQTKLQPAGGDPTQQKIMMFMPIMFTLMSFSFPSGLVIYWLVATLFTIGQQFVTNALIGAPAKPASK